MNSIIEKVDLLTSAIARNIMINKSTIDKQVKKYNLSKNEIQKLYDFLVSVRY